MDEILQRHYPFQGLDKGYQNQSKPPQRAPWFALIIFLITTATSWCSIRAASGADAETQSTKIADLLRQQHVNSPHLRYWLRDAGIHSQLSKLIIIQINQISKASFSDKYVNNLHSLHRGGL